MKREGRQHGVVQTYPIIPSPWNPTEPTRRVNQFDTPPTAGFFTKVSRKPTNHSKYTSKCSRSKCLCCHDHPAGKAKDKTKGNHKLRSCDVVTNYRLVTWRVVDARPGFNFSGFSATGILDQMASDFVDYEDEIDDDEVYEREYNWMAESDREITSRPVEIEEVDDDDDKMSFCDVGLVLEQVDDEDEGWCWVEEEI